MRSRNRHQARRKILTRDSAKPKLVSGLRRARATNVFYTQSNAFQTADVFLSCVCVFIEKSNARFRVGDSLRTLFSNVSLVDCQRALSHSKISSVLP